jgi:hypothetical protein
VSWDVRDEQVAPVEGGTEGMLWERRGYRGWAAVGGG